MKVLISDALSKEGLAILHASAGLTVVSKAGLKGDELLKAVADCEALIVRSGTTVTADVIAHAKKLKIIGRAGAGVDNIDCVAATQAGVIVVNTPGGNATTTAEHTLAMLMALSRHIPQANQSVKSGLWERSKFTGSEITGKILGVIGFGNIGKIVAARARALQMRVLIFDPFLSAEVVTKEGFEAVTLDELCKRVDFLTVHVPLSDATKNLIHAQSVQLMKPGVRILNCARGGIVNEEALLAGLQSGKIAGVAVDVFTDEPPPKDHPFLKHDKVICTPHLGAATEEAQLNVAIQVAEQIRDFLQSGEIRHAVNFPSISSEMVKVLKPYISLCTKLGAFLGQISYVNRSKVKKIHIKYAGAAALYETKVLTSTIVKEFLTPVLAASVNYINARSLAESRGILIEESFQQQVLDFANQITLTVTDDKQDYLLSGAVFGRDNCRFVRFNNFYLEVMPAGHLLVVHNYDRPGVVGKMGTILGSNHINISRMQLALDSSSPDNAADRQAVSFINIDQPADDQTLALIKQLDNIIAVYQVTLDSIQ